jgi:hypothetical protein
MGAVYNTVRQKLIIFLEVINQLIFVMEIAVAYLGRRKNE